MEGLQRGDGDGGIDISEDKSNHLLIKPSTRGLLYTVGGGEGEGGGVGGPVTLSLYTYECSELGP